MHCYTSSIRILEKYPSRGSNLLGLQGSNLQLYKIRGLSWPNVKELGQRLIFAKNDFF